MLLMVKGVAGHRFVSLQPLARPPHAAKDNRTSTGEHRKVVDTVDSKFLVKAVAVGG